MTLICSWREPDRGLEWWRKRGEGAKHPPTDDWSVTQRGRGADEASHRRGRLKDRERERALEEA